MARRLRLCAADTTVVNARSSAKLHDAERPAAPGRNGLDVRREPSASSAAVFVASPVASLCRLWQSGIRRFFTSEITDHGQLVRIMRLHKPAILLLDLELPKLGGIEGVAALQELSPDTRIVLLTSRPDEKEGIRALKLGAKGYCDRAVTPALLAKAVDAVLAGEIWIGRRLTSHLLDELAAAASAQQPASDAGSGSGLLKQLTPRERDILDLLGSGASNKEISHTLGVTERTVKAHLTAVFRKLGISSRVQAALLALEAARSSAGGATTNVQLTK